MKWGSIIPLIGGTNIGASIATRNKPDWILSYPEFAANDKHMKNYWPDVPFYLLDKKTNRINESLKGVDFVTTTCPCAGLSTANTVNRGADAYQNDWMYTTAHAILSQVKPKVFWGENAPGLFTKSGAKVAENLKNIGKLYNYSFSMIKTSTSLHGIPQKRVRTFYFFWKNSFAPIFHWYDRNKPKKVSEYLNLIPDWAEHKDLYLNDDLKNNIFWKWFNSSFIRKDLFETKSKTIMQFITKKNLFNDFADFCRANKDKKTEKYILSAQEKVLNGTNYWDNSPVILNDLDNLNAITGRSMKMYTHPIENRFLSIREYMHLMGLPHVFNLENPTRDYLSITQNVPTLTAKDMTIEVINFIKGNLQLSKNHFLKQDNIKKTINLF